MLSLNAVSITSLSLYHMLCHIVGDLKPENIMIKVASAELNVADIKIIDFGLSKVLAYNQK
jgi:serine/threonine protein kinase